MLAHRPGMTPTVLLHRICMPNIAPCGLTRNPGATKLPRCTHPPPPRQIRPRFTPDFAPGLAAARAGRPDRLRRRGRDVVGRGGDAGGAAGIRRHPRRGIARRHHDLLRLRSRRRHHRQDHRPARHRAGDGRQHRLPDRLLCAGWTVDRAVAVHRHLFPDGPRHVGHLRAADGGGLALVRSLSRPRGDHRRVRQLCRGHVLAADDQLEHAGLWLARHPFRHRHCRAAC